MKEKHALRKTQLFIEAILDDRRALGVPTSQDNGIFMLGVVFYSVNFRQSN